MGFLLDHIGRAFRPRDDLDVIDHRMLLVTDPRPYRRSNNLLPPVPRAFQLSTLGCKSKVSPRHRFLRPEIGWRYRSTSARPILSSEPSSPSLLMSAPASKLCARCRTLYPRLSRGTLMSSILLLCTFYPLEPVLISQLICCVSFPEPDTGALKKRSIHDALVPRSLSSKCADGTTPACLQKLYHIPTTPAQNTSNKLAVTGRYGNNAHYKWLQVPLSHHQDDTIVDKCVYFFRSSYRSTALTWTRRLTSQLPFWTAVTTTRTSRLSLKACVHQVRG